MRTISRALALACIAAAAFTAGCETTKNADELQPQSGTLHPGNRGVQAKNIQEMSDNMAASILKARTIVDSKYKITIVMYPIVSDQGQDMTIANARLRMLLNKYARDRLAFVENRKTTERIQGEEFGGGAAPIGEDQGRTAEPPPAPNRLLPQYVMKGECRTMRNNATTYYLFTFQLTRIMPGATSGEIVWEDGYELSALN